MHTFSQPSVRDVHGHLSIDQIARTIDASSGILAKFESNGQTGGVGETNIVMMVSVKNRSHMEYAVKTAFI